MQVACTVHLNKWVASGRNRPRNCSLFPDAIWKECKRPFFSWCICNHCYMQLFLPQLTGEKNKDPSDTSGTMWAFHLYNQNSEEDLKDNFCWAKVGIYYKNLFSKSESWYVTESFVLKYRNPTDFFQSSEICFSSNCSKPGYSDPWSPQPRWKVSEFIHRICYTDLAFKVLIPNRSFDFKWCLSHNSHWLSNEDTLIQFCFSDREN